MKIVFNKYGDNVILAGWFAVLTGAITGHLYTLFRRLRTRRIDGLSDEFETVQVSWYLRRSVYPAYYRSLESQLKWE